MTDKKNLDEIEPISGRRNFLTSVITTGAIAAVTPQSVGAAEPINKLPSALPPNGQRVNAETLPPSEIARVPESQDRILWWM